MTPRLFSSITAAAAFFATLLTGCSQPPTFTGDGAFAANTSQTFRENRVFYLSKELNILGPDAQPLPSSDVDVRRLVPIYKPPTNADDNITDGSPLSVLVSSVRIPECIDGPFDVAVVLDMYTGIDPKEQVTSMVVWYQRDVRGGMTLAFQNMVVYTTDSWSSDSPPLFRLRLVDVKAERNNATAGILAKTEQLANTFAEVIPSPAIPIVSTAITAAKLILGNQQNKIIIDYTVQFYGAAFVASLGDRANVASLQRGGWLVVGLPKDQPSRFWRTPMVFDQHTEELFDERDIPPTPGPISAASQPLYNLGVQSPYITMTIAPYSAQVYGIVQQRSEALMRLLTSKGPQTAAEVTALSDELKKNVQTFVLMRKLRRERSVVAVDTIITTIKDKKDTVDVPALTAELRRIWPTKYADKLEPSLNGASPTWWNTNFSKLTFDRDRYRLVAPEGL